MATGGAYPVEPIFSNEDFAVTKGKARIFEHRSEGRSTTTPAPTPVCIAPTNLATPTVAGIASPPFA